MSDNKTTNDTVKKYRNFVSIVYPDSAPDNWIELLKEEHIPFIVSPLHDLDCNPDGEIKKAHFHVMLCYDGPHTIEQAKKIFEKIGGVGCQVVNNLRSHARYFCHLDNPDKHEYSTDDVIVYGGLDYITIIGLPSDKYKAIADMIDFCTINHIYSYHTLLTYSKEHKADWFRILCDSGTVVMKEFLKSFHWAETHQSESEYKPD